MVLLVLIPFSLPVGERGTPFGNAQTTEEYVRNYFIDIPVMADIAYCESRFRHVDSNGNLYRGEINYLDVGVMQINEYYHLTQAVKLGYDIYTLDGNLTYARWLYNEEGTVPWLSSSLCWEKESYIAMN